MSKGKQGYSLHYREDYVTGFYATDDIAAANDSLNFMRKYESKGATLYRLSPDGLTHVASIRAHNTEPLLWVQKTEEFDPQE